MKVKPADFTDAEVKEFGERYDSASESIASLFTPTRTILEMMGGPAIPKLSGFDLMQTRRRNPTRAQVERLRLYAEAKESRKAWASKPVSIRPIRIPMQVKSA